MIVIKFQKCHFTFAVRTFQRIVAKGRKYSSSPLIKTAKDMMLFTRNSTVKLLVNFTMSCVDPTIPDHFKIFFWYVSNQPFDKVHGRNGFGDKFIIFMPIVVKCDHFTVIFINTGSGDNRTAKIAANILILSQSTGL